MQNPMVKQEDTATNTPPSMLHSHHQSHYPRVHNRRVVRVRSILQQSQRQQAPELPLEEAARLVSLRIIFIRKVVSTYFSQFMVFCYTNYTQLCVRQRRIKADIQLG